MDETVPTWVQVSRVDFNDFWARADMGLAPKPWHQPPQVGVDTLEELLILTSAFRVYHLNSFKEFHRIMVRGGVIKFVHPNGVEEVVLEVYARYQVPIRSERIISRVFGSGGVIKDPPDNVVQFKRPSK